MRFVPGQVRPMAVALHLKVVIQRRISIYMCVCEEYMKTAAAIEGI